MTINISAALRRWLLEKGLDGYIKVAEAPPHPDAFNIAQKLNVDTITNTMVRQKLGLSGLGEKQFDIAPAETLRKYFAEYSLTAKAYRTKEIPNAFFREVAKFLLEVGCVHVNAYGMPKQKAGVVIETFEGKAVDWGVITGPALREGLHSYQSGKKLRPIIQQYLTVLFPPHGIAGPATSQPSPGQRSAKRRLAVLAATEWEDEPRPSQAEAQVTAEERPTHTDPAAEQEEEPDRASPRPKKRRLDRKDGRGLVKDAPIQTADTTETGVAEERADDRTTEKATTSNTRKDRRKGKEIQAEENEDLNDPVILDTAHEFAALLQTGKAYELIEFLATQQIKAVQRKIQENTEGQTQAELQKAYTRIAELERSITRAQQQTPVPDRVREPSHDKEVEAQTVTTEKTKRALRKAESEIDRLRGELRQSSERERDIRAKGRKAVRKLEEQLAMEHSAHDVTTSENNRLQDEVTKLEDVNKRLRSVLEERKKGYEEQLNHEREEAQLVRRRLQKENEELLDHHGKEAAIWKEMKEQYDQATVLYKQEIANVKNTLHTTQNHLEAVRNNVRSVLQTNREKFTAQIKAAMDKGWEAWAVQAAELHTYRADWENRKKEGRGFYKLSEETVATVREDLAKDYSELAERHSEEITQILDDFGEGQEELLDQLMEAQGKNQIAVPEVGLAGAIAGEKVSPHVPIGGEISGDKTQNPEIPQPEEPILSNRTEHVDQPTAQDTEGEGESTQQTEEPGAKEGHTSFAQEPVPENNMDRNESTEQGTGSKDATATPDSAPQEPHRQETQLIHEITPEEGQDTRIEPGILDILESE